MALRSDIRTEARAIIQERAEAVVLDTDLNRWVNYGLKDFTARVQWYQRLVALAVVARIPEITLPTDIIKVEMVRWKAGQRVRMVDKSTYAYATFAGVAQGEPVRCTVFPHDKRLILDNAPSASSPTTTISVGGISSSVTTIPVAATSSFRADGFLLVESEQIRHFNSDATNFLLARRGDADTTAAAHLAAVTVTEGTLQLWCRSLPPDLSDDLTALKIPEHYIPIISKYVAAQALMGPMQKMAEGSAILKEYKIGREEAREERESETMDGCEGVKDEEYGMGWYGDA